MKRITKIGTTATVETKKTRVAAYCRVSTSSDEQLISLDAQKLHYEDYIQSMMIGNMQGYIMMKESRVPRQKSETDCRHFLETARMER